MSKQSLQAAAERASGVSYEKSLIAVQLKPSIFERIGEKGFLKLSGEWYFIIAVQDIPFFVKEALILL